MKKLNPRTILFVVLMISSLCSYLYLRQVSVELPVTVQEDQVAVEEELDRNEVMLPNVTLIKKAFEIGRRFWH